MKRAAAIASIALALSACVGTRFEWSQAKSVTVGMSAAELEQRMGKPYAVAQRGETTEWTYAWGNIAGQHRVITYGLRDGKVATVPALPNAE